MPVGREVKIEHLDARLDLTYNWGYEKSRQDLRDLYKKAQRSQWQPDATLPWQTSVDLEHPHYPEELFPLYGSDIYNKMSEKQKSQLGVEMFSWILSQFLHGEQGALLAAAQLVTARAGHGREVLRLDAGVTTRGATSRSTTATCTRRSASRIRSRPYLKKLLDLILTDSRWDMKFLGMQIMVEGLALAAFGMIRQQTSEPLLKKLTHYVMLDEARHVAYGVLSLKNHYDDMKESDKMEREDFIYEAAVLMRDRFLYQQVWEKMGMPVDECKAIALNSMPQQMFRQMLFSKIVPAVKKMGLHQRSPAQALRRPRHPPVRVVGRSVRRPRARDGKHRRARRVAARRGGGEARGRGARARA